jgi:chromosome segregation ATPase
MTKSEEIETLKTIVKNLPKRSYLAELFKHIVPQFERDVRSDFLTLPDIKAIEHDLLQFQDQVKREAAQVNALIRQRQELVNEISELKYRESQIKDRLASVKNLINNALA